LRTWGDTTTAVFSSFCFISCGNSSSPRALSLSLPRGAGAAAAVNEYGFPIHTARPVCVYWCHCSLLFRHAELSRFQFLNRRQPPGAASTSRLKKTATWNSLWLLCVSVSTPAALEINCNWSLQSTSPLCPQRHEMSCIKKTIS
jgi:hypothetical protein